jgi:hypothetical protein
VLADSDLQKLVEVLEEHRKQHESIYLLLLDRLAPEAPAQELPIGADLEANRKAIRELTKNFEPLMFVGLDDGNKSFCYGALGQFVDRPPLDEWLNALAQQTQERHLSN